MSEISLRSESERPNKLEHLPEEEPESDVSSQEGSKGSSKKGQSFKKQSLVSLGLAAGEYLTQFEEEDEGLGDAEAPGAFRRPESAYRLARYAMHMKAL